MRLDSERAKDTLFQESDGSSISRPRENLSVIVLCYRSEESIIPFVRNLVRELPEVDGSWEVILVGNYIPGSTDRTGGIVTGLAAENENVRAVVEPKSGMMGWDMRKGLQASKGDYLCIIDGDGQYPIQAVGTCFRTIRFGEYDLVKTFRKRRFDGFVRSFISHCYNIIVSLLFPGIGSSDINSKPKMISRSAYEKMELTSNDWFIDAEIMLNIRCLGLSYMEFPIEFRELEDRRSFVNFRTVLEFFRNLVCYRIREFRKGAIAKGEGDT